MNKTPYKRYTSRLEKTHIKKIKDISKKAQKELKIGTKGNGRELVSQDAVIRYAISKVDINEFLRDLKKISTVIIDSVA